MPAGLEGLAGEIRRLAAVDRGRLGGALAAAQLLALERLEDQLAAVKLGLLATVDAQGAAGAEAGVQFLSTAGWLRARLRMSAGVANQRVRTARALYRGPLGETAATLAAAEVSYHHATVLAEVTRDLPAAEVSEAEPVLVDAARRLDPAQLRRLATHLRNVVDPERAEDRTRRRLDRRGLWLSPTFEGMVDVEGLLDPEAGEAVRRLACDAVLTRALVHRHTAGTGPATTQGGHAADHGQPNGHGQVHPDGSHASHDGASHAVPSHDGHDGAGHGGLAERVRAAVALLPPPLGAPVELLDLGRATRVISPALRRALAVRDGGCAAAGCDRPPGWTDAHHLRHWVHGGPTSLDNLVLLCRTHHVAVHEGGWRLARDPASGRWS